MSNDQAINNNNNSVSVQGIDECANNLELIFNKLTDNYDKIIQALNNYAITLDRIKDCNETFKEKAVPTDEYSNICKYKARIRRVEVNSEGDINDYIAALKHSELEENINIIKQEVYSLEEMSNNLSRYINIIKYQLSPDKTCETPLNFNGSINDFFTNLKSNPDWKVLKDANEESLKLKQTDEIYMKFHSNERENYDYVDYALDHLGVPFVPATYSSFAATWYNLEISKDANKDNEWCAEFVSYVMMTTGNINSMPGTYLDCNIGAEKAKQASEDGLGTWHDATEDYQPQRGDVFYNTDHTGIVVASDDEYIYTIEGNTARDDGTYYVRNTPSENKGGIVNTRIREKDGYVKIGYYTPDNNNVISDEKKLESQNPNFTNEYKQKKLQTQELFEQHKKDTGHE